MSLPEESQPPVIHDMMTTSPGDHELLGATPFVTSVDLGAPLDVPAPEIPPPEESGEIEEPLEEEVLPAPSTEPVVSVPAETLTAADADVGVAAEASNQQIGETVTDLIADEGLIKTKEEELEKEKEAAAEQDPVVQEGEEMLEGEEEEEEGMLSDDKSCKM